MEKLWLIIKREYLTRVRKRSFLLATFLTPLAFAIFFVIIGVIFSYESGETLHIAIVDEGKILRNNFSKDEDNLYFHVVSTPLEELRETFGAGKYDGILVLPKIGQLQAQDHTVYYYREKPLGLDVRTTVVAKVRNRIRDYKMRMLNLEEVDIRSLKVSVEFQPEAIREGDAESSSMAAWIAAAIGGMMGVIMYMTVFIYGMMVMRSVMEEKMNRIVEVMISSVKPFQLMMGKIIGVGAVGLTQVAIWGILIPLVYGLVFLLFGFNSSQTEMAMSTADIDQVDLQLMAEQIGGELWSQNWALILPLFVFYFLGGYFLYASLFAAVGSAMGDDMGEGQALTIPITIPVVLAFYIMFVAVRAPQSNLAVWSSIFPLFSPIVMPARLAFDPPWWEIAASVLSLAATAIFFVWLSGRIYRVGILMYGKKVSLREIGRWLFYRG
ncbi:MAG: ABC transporter permease [Bacteroidota bacterium]